ncbi:MAG: alpha/beta fold hydrolase [Hyphomicrobiaceae bacterium]
MCTNENPSDNAHSIVSIGTGAPILVFHGGPGFSHKYLVRWLSFLSKTHTLLFFDQLSSSAPPFQDQNIAVSFDDTIKQAREIIADVSDGKQLTLISHSWGALVALTALKEFPQLKLNGLLINPVPSTRAGFDEVRDRLFARLPHSALEAIASPNSTHLSAEELNFILPYYLSPNSTAELDDLTFDLASYRQVYGSLGDYDIRPELHRLSECLLITGADDFIQADDLKDFISTCCSTSNIPSVGHFPFAEQPDQFQSLVSRFLISTKET